MAAGALVALHPFEDSFLGLVPGSAFSDSWHISFPCTDVGIWSLVFGFDSADRAFARETVKARSLPNTIDYSTYCSLSLRLAGGS
jgi:hypothetical protein